MKKKIVSWLLATAMVMTCVPMNASASDFETDTVVEAEADVTADTASEQEETFAESDETQTAVAEEVSVQIEEEIPVQPEEELTEESGPIETVEENGNTETADGIENTEEIPQPAEVYEDPVEELFEDDFADFSELAAGAEEGEPIEGYVLMNIPYDEFYKAEKSVDVVSGATAKKRSNANLAGGSYHVGEDGSDITGVTFPVKIGSQDLEADNKYKKADNADALFENVSYAYAPITKEPSFYKELKEDGSFGAVQGQRTVVSGASVTLNLTDKHADYVLKVEGLKLAEDENVSAVVLGTSDGAAYGLRHVNNIWKKTELGWNKSDESYASLTGKTVSKITYITTQGIYEIDADVKIEDVTYVLMNIPYDKFYEKELADGSAPVDAVSSATKAKTRTGTLAGGSYHVNEDGSDITGIVYPVKVNPADLNADKEIKGDAKLEITVTNRGKASTTTYEGKDALFGKPSYSYYVLSEKPKAYKVLEKGSFSAVKGLKAKDTASQTAGATATLKTNPGHTDYEISIDNFKLADGENLSAAIFTTADGATYGLRHVANIWRNGVELGWNADESGFAGLAGNTITKISFITQKGLYELNVNIPVEKFTYALMNIPYEEFYAAELAEGSAAVDAVSSATKNKPRTATLAGGSYHVNADGSDITGVIYPVRINVSALKGLKEITDTDSVDITVTNRGQTSTTTYTGKDALFEAPSYSYYLLSEKPARYKTVSVADGKLTFSAVSGRAAAQNAEAEIVTAGKHTFYEMSLKNVEISENISGAYLTDADGKTYGLRHIANIWRTTEIGWEPDELDLSGKTIKTITYITQNAKTAYTIDVKVPIYYKGEISAVFDTSLKKISLSGLPKDLENAKVSVYQVPGNRQPNVYVAQDAKLSGDSAELSENAALDTEYTVMVTSDNYAAMLTTVKAIDLSKGAIELSEKNYKFNGKAKQPKVTVTLNGETVSDNYYTITYSNNVEIGTASVSVEGKNGYYGTLKASFKIARNPAAKSTLNSKLKGVFKGNALSITWGKVSSASGYEIYVAQCGKSLPSKPVKTIKNNSTTSLKITRLNGKKLDLTKNYKFRVFAYRIVNGKKVLLATSYTLHIAGTNNRTYTNAGSVTTKKSAYSVKAGKTLKLAPSVKKADSKKALFPKKHAARLCYWSTNSDVATVNANGKVTGVKKGTCYVYIMAANGAKKRIKITVK